VYATLEAAHAALASSRYPKLLFAGDPGALVSPAFAERFAATLHNCKLVQLGAGAHYLQEDHPETIGTLRRRSIVLISPACPERRYQIPFDDSTRSGSAGTGSRIALRIEHLRRQAWQSYSQRR
jgi:hypothetical protein